MSVILNGVKNLIISTESIREILRLSLQNDIATQSERGERNRVRGLSEEKSGDGKNSGYWSDSR